MTSNRDAELMRAAYREALRAVGNSDPNPAVGAVVTTADGTILSRGFTQPVGFAHAERHALDQIRHKDITGATLYVTLEPCCHHGRTPPCVDAIVERKIGRVVIAERDFAAEVMGRSVAILREKGVDVAVLKDGIFERESWLTTGPFFFARTHNRPRVTLKWAQTKDGALAPVSGPSGKISGEKAAFVTAALRNCHKLTVATPGTVRIDKPALTVRFHQAPDLGNSGLSETFLALLSVQAEHTELKPAAQLYMQTTPALHNDFPMAMSAILTGFAADGFNSVLIEAGPIFSQLLLDADLVDGMAIYRSKFKTAAALWENSGRGNTISRKLASDDFSPLGTFQLMEQADLDDDDFLFFRRV